MQQCSHLTIENLSNSVQGKFIYKDQCTKCFGDPFCEQGLKVCLKCFNGGCVSKYNHSEEHFKNTNHAIALIFKQKKIPVIQEQQNIPPEQKITKIAIGKPGGAEIENKFEIITETQLFCFGCNSYIDGSTITGLIESVIKAETASFATSIQEWELQIFPCEHTLTLQQNQPFKILDNSLAHCGECALSTNLWLCLTCGHLGCGRKVHGEAIGITGGNNHAIDHSNQFKHPLVVKMGTITPEGTASIYCYTCNDDIKDDNLATHLANFGIMVSDQKKTEKTMQELDLQVNLNLQLSKSMEEGKQLEAIFGSGYTGIQNMGNTCYINSVLQVLFSLDEIKNKYFLQGQNHLLNCKKFAPECLLCQFSKIGHGLWSGDYSIKKEAKILEVADKSEEQKIDAKMIEKLEPYQDGLQIHNFKQLIGKGHKEFSSNQQQDAWEFMNHLFASLQKAEKSANFGDLTSLFNFKQVTLLSCLKCGGYKIRENQASEIKLNCPYVKQEKEESEYQVNFSELLGNYLQGETVEVNCPKCGANSFFRKNQYLASLPKYLIVSIQRFVFDNWVPTKVQAYIQTQDMIDLQQFQFQEPNPNLKLPDSDQSQQQQAPQVNQESLAQLTMMGFGVNRASRALIANNQNPEEAMNWIFATMDDASLDLPLENKPQLGGGADQISEILIEQIVMMGFTPQQAKHALSKTNKDVERAIDYLFNHPDEQMEDENIQQSSDEQQQQVQNQQSNSTKYQLQGGIIHLGRSVHCGHYVCYAKNEKNEWIYFNDSKVAQSSEPLLGKAYIYIFKQV